LLLAYKASAPMGDFEHELTESGVQRAQRWMKRCTFYGAAPVPLHEYVQSVAQQTVRNSRPRFSAVVNAFADLSLSETMISQVGQAITAGRGMFLYGAPGNGKTSIAERVIRSIGDTIWIPRTITVGGEIIRLFDPANHLEAPAEAKPSGTRIDQRWVRIMRPTVVVGGELTLEQLDMSVDKVSGILEAPLQMKSNFGALVIDDFGRQRVSPIDLLNRWIVPLEKGFDFQTLPAGRQVQVPFDQLLVFATNLVPRQLVDEAFLRRIPYKVEVVDPTESEFRRVFEGLSQTMKIAMEPGVVDYLIETHYKAVGRPLRYCHVRDLLLQVLHMCEFHERPAELNRKTADVAAHNYFGGL
jgi:predicted ATPase with chaperone activity